jgi:flagella basal body P-ring formation protein FlgA
MDHGIRRTLALAALLSWSLLSLGVVSGRASEAATSLSLRQRICDSAAVFVSQRVSVPNDSISVEVDLPPISAHAGDVTGFRFALLSAKEVAGTVPFRVTLSLRDGNQLPFTGAARVKVYDTVAVATRRLGRHETITGNDIRFERRDITHLTDSCFSESRRVVGKRVKRVITVGTMLKSSDVETIPLVGRGSGVIVSIVVGAVSVTSKAKALEDGELGELIRVQDLVTGKRLTGTVAGDRLVVLDRPAF